MHASQPSAAQPVFTDHHQTLPGLDSPFTMIAVKGGLFDMGGESWDGGSWPVHPVELTDFGIGKYPVTQALWMAVMGADHNPSRFKGRNRPVERVSWKMIKDDFLPAINRITQRTRPQGTEYHLPTEAQWEYAAQLGSENQVYSGSKILDETGWYDQNSHGETKPVGLKLPNKLGIYDLNGNVWEWCADWYDGKYYEDCRKRGVARNPEGPKNGRDRVLRGGSWHYGAQGCRSANRVGNEPSGHNADLGFRLVLFPF